MKYLLILCLIPFCVYAEPTINASRFSVAPKSTEIDAETSTLDSEPSKFNYQGYIYQGFSKSNGNNYRGQSTNPEGSFQDRDIGILGSYAVNPYVDLRAFFKSKQRGSRYDGIGTDFSYALVDLHTPMPFDGIAGVRLGRVRNEVGFYNATMENPVARDTDVLPQAIYRTEVESLLNSGDGYQIYYDTNALPVINLSVMYSQITPNFTPKSDVLAVWFIGIPTGSFVRDELGFATVNMLITSKDLQWQFRYDHADMKVNYVSGVGDFIPTGDYGLRSDAYAIRKYFKNFDITYEYLMIESPGVGYANFGGAPPALGQNIVLRYNMNSQLSYIVGYNEWNTDITDRSGVVSAAKYGVIPETVFYYDANIGFNYRHTKNLIFKGSYHQIQGTARMSQIDNPTITSNGARTDELYNLSVTYGF